MIWSQRRPSAAAPCPTNSTRPATPPPSITRHDTVLDPLPLVPTLALIPSTPSSMRSFDNDLSLIAHCAPDIPRHALVARADVAWAARTAAGALPLADQRADAPVALRGDVEKVMVGDEVVSLRHVLIPPVAVESDTMSGVSAVEENKAVAKHAGRGTVLADAKAAVQRAWKRASTAKWPGSKRATLDKAAAAHDVDAGMTMSHAPRAGAPSCPTRPAPLAPAPPVMALTWSPPRAAALSMLLDEVREEDESVEDENDHLDVVQAMQMSPVVTPSSRVSTMARPASPQTPPSASRSAARAKKRSQILSLSDLDWDARALIRQLNADTEVAGVNASLASSSSSDSAATVKGGIAPAVEPPPTIMPARFRPMTASSSTSTLTALPAYSIMATTNATMPPLGTSPPPYPAMAAVTEEGSSQGNKGAAVTGKASRP
ncbi:hypothetical protein AMAG_15022 [Allomyces macrogynus ATCC 38327]|uniref:Uncharacterized protein n=1 Tax=Allomyces macrogynus (strain ATCC 38327) TaxID=578462 RepID=A0A0L0T801_ALLM3|nr:hypothetical protein AMAG_15022 [Allomyces macrogynus ATCC 38327]|eukprot:KNE70933.1 hypothetical protein AMAG_15022 [Allomyces macrogynus ATCC 38327]